MRTRPVTDFFAYLSAVYEVRRDRWQDVAIEVYHHPPHAVNVDRMIGAVKKSLDSLTASFGPYPYRQVRILEFPPYERFAQSFPNTIQFSESAAPSSTATASSLAWTTPRTRSTTSST